MRRARLLWMTLAVAICAVLGASDAAAQSWWVQSADYGAGNQRQDVTNTVRRLVNGPNFRVNNKNLGADPAVGRDKTLRIVAKDGNGNVRDFHYKEGQTVNAQMFTGGLARDGRAGEGVREVRAGVAAGIPGYASPRPCGAWDRASRTSLTGCKAWYATTSFLSELRRRRWAATRWSGLPRC